MTPSEPAQSVNPPSQTQSDVGSLLRQARLRRGQSLEAVHQHTRIPKKLIEALENNRFDVFPATVYLRGFLKNYCDHLDVDFDPLWERIMPPKPAVAAQARSGPSPSKETAGSAAGAGPAPNAVSDRISLCEASADPQAAPEPREESRDLKTVLPLLLGAAILLGGFWAFARRQRPAPPLPALPPPPAIAPLHASEKMTLRIIFHRESWLRLACDGRLRFEGRGPAGFVQEWPAVNAFLLRSSSPGDLGLALNGKELKLGPELLDPSGNYKIARP